VWLFGPQPADQITEPLVHAVDIEGSYFHRPMGLRPGLLILSSP
jgi:hypothetical protein